MADTAGLKSYSDIPLVHFEEFTPDTSSYEVFNRWREASPLVKAPLGFGHMVLALRARTVEQIVGHQTRQLETESKILQGVFDGPIYDFIAQVMLFSNGAVHQRRRQPVARTFAFKLMEAMRSKAAAVAAEIIHERLNSGPFDYVQEFAAQIPARIIADILGIPRSDLPVFMQWISDTAEAIGFIDIERRPQIEQSLLAFNDYVDQLLADRRRAPRADFLSDYVAATSSSGDLTEGEIRAQIVGLILAGSDTTRNAMCMTLFQLLRHPDQWQSMTEDPDGLKKKAAEEGLRFEPVVTAIPRVAVEDMAVEGYLIPAGAMISVSLLSVLRDPELYANPDQFDIHRTDQQRWHLAFGAGAHRCAGEALARVELEEVLAAIARLAPATRIIGAAPRLGTGAIRAVDQMRVAFA